MISIGNFTILDWLILTVLVYSVAISVLHGFIREVFGLASIVVALVLAAWFHQGVSSIFKDVVRTENLALFLGFSLVFFGVLGASVLGVWLITKFIRFARLEWADRLLGAAFGFVRGWMIGSVILLGLTAFEIQTERVRSSELAPYFLPGSRVIATVTPYELKARFLVGYRGIERWWREQ